MLNKTLIIYCLLTVSMLLFMLSCFLIISTLQNGSTTSEENTVALEGVPKYKFIYKGPSK